MGKSTQPFQRAIERRYHLVTDTTLEGWANEGDDEARFVLLKRNRVRTMIKNNKGGTEYCNVCLSPNVSLLFQKGNSVHGWVTMSIMVSDDLSINDFRGNNKNIWAAITQWRQFLSEWQGPGTTGGEGNLLLRLCILMETLKNKDVSIARRLDQVIAKDLKEYVEDCKSFEKNCESFKTHLDAFLWEGDESRKGSYCFRRGKRAAHSLMVTMGLTPDSAEEWCAEAIDLFSKGERVIWKKVGPITSGNRPGDRVHSKIREFKNRHRAWLQSKNLK